MVEFKSDLKNNYQFDTKKAEGFVSKYTLNTKNSSFSVLEYREKGHKFKTQIHNE